MIADAIVMFFCDVGSQPILQLSNYNTSFYKVIVHYFVDFNSS